MHIHDGTGTVATRHRISDGHGLWRAQPPSASAPEQRDQQQDVGTHPPERLSRTTGAPPAPRHHNWNLETLSVLPKKYFVAISRPESVRGTGTSGTLTATPQPPSEHYIISNKSNKGTTIYVVDSFSLDDPALWRWDRRRIHHPWCSEQANLVSLQTVELLHALGKQLDCGCVTSGHASPCRVSRRRGSVKCEPPAKRSTKRQRSGAKSGKRNTEREFGVFSRAHLFFWPVSPPRGYLFIMLFPFSFVIVIPPWLP